MAVSRFPCVLRRVDKRREEKQKKLKPWERWNTRGFCLAQLTATVREKEPALVSKTRLGRTAETEPKVLLALLMLYIRRFLMLLLVLMCFFHICLTSSYAYPCKVTWTNPYIFYSHHYPPCKNNLNCIMYVHNVSAASKTSVACFLYGLGQN